MRSEFSVICALGCTVYHKFDSTAYPIKPAFEISKLLIIFVCLFVTGLKMSVYSKRGHCCCKAGSQVAKGSLTTVFKNRLAEDPKAKIPILEAVSVAVKEYALPSCNNSADAQEVQHTTLQQFVETLTDTVIDELPPHPNVCRLYGVEVVDGKATGGGLDRVLLTWGWVEKMERPKQPEAAKLPEGDAKIVAKDLVAAIAHLHSHSVTHDDVRPQNVLLSRVHDTDGRTFKSIITDYSLIRTIHQLLDPSSGMATTKKKPNYCAPEVFTSADYDAFKADVWGVGATILELMSGKLPYYELDPSGKGNIMFKIIQSRAPPKYPEGLSDNATNFLNACFEREFDKRPSVEELLDHPWLQDA